MNQLIKLTFITVGVYIVVSQASNAGKLLSAGGSAYSGAVKTLQGR